MLGTAFTCQVLAASFYQLDIVFFRVLQDSGTSRSDSDSSDSSGDENDDDQAIRGGSGRDTRSQKLAGRKHKSDTALQKDESKKSGGTSGEGSGNGAAVCPAQPKPLMITPDQLRALQTPGASLVFKPGKTKFEIAQEPGKFKFERIFAFKS